MLKTVHQKATRHLRPLVAWLKLLWRRIDEDNMTTLAGNLAYVSLLSLVPLIAVVFALFAAFPMFSDVSIRFATLFSPISFRQPEMSFRAILSSLSPTPAG
jgi:membrane protein